MAGCHCRLAKVASKTAVVREMLLGASRTLAGRGLLDEDDVAGTSRFWSETQPYVSIAFLEFGLRQICACWYVMGIWRKLERESSSGPIGRRSDCWRANRSGLRIVYRRGSGIIYSNGSATHCPSWKAGRESIRWNSVGNLAAAVVLEHPLARVLQRLVQAV